MTEPNVHQLQLALLSEPLPPRPRNRSDCRFGPRPCPWVGCRQNLFLDVLPTGRIKLAFPGREPDEMPPGASCALDVADRGEHSVVAVAPLVGLTPERIRQIEVQAKRRLRVLLNDEESEGIMAAKKAKKAKANGAWKQAVTASTMFRPLDKTGKKQREDAVERSRRKQKCPVKIASEDVEKKADALAKVIQDRDVVLEEKREANAEYREKLNYFDERLKELAESVRSHTEVRDVEVVEFFLERTGEMVLIRQDTGEQVGEPRAATAEDRQDKLDLDGDEVEDDDDIPFGKLAGDQEKAADARPGDGG